MTRKEIKAMFAVGQRWHAVRTDPPTVVHGNIGKTTLVSKHRDELRTVKQVRSEDIVFTLADGRDYYTPLPKASEIVTARPGYLHFTLLDGKVDVKLTECALDNRE